MFGSDQHHSESFAAATLLEGEMPCATTPAPSTGIRSHRGTGNSQRRSTRGNVAPTRSPAILRQSSATSGVPCHRHLPSSSSSAVPQPRLTSPSRRTQRSFVFSERREQIRLQCAAEKLSAVPGHFWIAGSFVQKLRAPVSRRRHILELLKSRPCAMPSYDVGYDSPLLTADGIAIW